MWKLYRRRHLWLFQVYSLFRAFYGSSPGDSGAGSSVPLSPSYGRHLLNAGNTTSSPDGLGVVPSCIPPSIDEFPEDFFTQEQRQKGGLVVHALIVAYACAMLAIVCDKYFVPSLDVISTFFKVPSDIAGATFMAVGTSSPELFSSLIGVFVTEGDIGVGTVVGSAVFNILAVTGAAGFAVGSAVVNLDWYPITRDCSMYVITISALIFIIHDNLVTWIEAMVLLLMFACYLTLLYFNCHIKNVTTKTVANVHNWWKNRSCSLAIYPSERPKTGEESPLLISTSPPPRYHSNGDSACGSSGTSSLVASDEMTTSGGSDTFIKESGLFGPEIITEKYVIVKDLDEELQCKKLSGEFEESAEVNLWSLPEGIFEKVIFFVMWIPNFLFFITIPRCDLPGRTKLFPLTFFASIVWLGVLSYLCFWMVAIIGYTLGIPDTVSGLTILAAGTSVPELVSSVIVVRNGKGNMAFCNLLGSNIFDILFCLGLPWLAKTLMNGETKSLVINSSAMTYTTLHLLLVVILFYFTLVLCNWKLNWKYGIVAFVLYAAFLVVASLFESNFFGDFNPPTCVS